MQADENGAMEMALGRCNLLEDMRHGASTSRSFSGLCVGTDVDRATACVHDDDAVTLLNTASLRDIGMRKRLSIPSKNSQGARFPESNEDWLLLQ